jgi:hypothetical protein
VTLFRPGEPPSGPAPEHSLGWTRLSAGDLEIHEFPGPAAGPLAEPQVRFVVEELKSCLERAQAAESGTGAE